MLGVQDTFNSVYWIEFLDKNVEIHKISVTLLLAAAANQCKNQARTFIKKL